MTGRQFLAWQAWLREDLNHPSRTDHYLMSIAAEVRRVMAKKPGDISLRDFLLRWEEPKPDTRTKEEKVAESKAVWRAFLGLDKPAPPTQQVGPPVITSRQQPPMPGSLGKQPLQEPSNTVNPASPSSSSREE